MERQRDWRRLGLWLVGATMAYNIVEAVVALASGWVAGSVALAGFGFDSVIETAAAALLFWRLRVEAGGADHERVERAERIGERFVGGTFIALAAYVVLQAGWTLIARDAPGESLVGIILAGVSLVVMPLVAAGKLRVAARLDSRALRAEAMETLACSYLSFTLLLGLGLHAWLGWWWADPVAALAMVPWLIREAREAFEGEEDED